MKVIGTMLQQVWCRAVSQKPWALGGTGSRAGLVRELPIYLTGSRRVRFGAFPLEEVLTAKVPECRPLPLLAAGKSDLEKLRGVERLKDKISLYRFELKSSV